jgi:hypothetical protein
VGSQTSGVSLIYTAGTPGTTSDDIYVGKIGQEGLDASVGLLDRSVHCIAADSRGRMWVGTSSGLTMLSGGYDRSTNTYSLVSTHYTIDRGLPANMVTAVLVDSYDHVWVGTTEGLARITPSGSVIKLSSAKLVDPSGNVSALAYDGANGYIWIGTPRGLNRYEAYSSSGGSEISVKPLQNPFPVELTKQGNMYVLSGEPLTIQVTPGATVRIYTITGQLVWQAVDGGAGRVLWDGRTRSGHDTVATGIYLYVAERDGVHKTGKIAVVRTIH